MEAMAGGWNERVTFERGWTFASVSGHPSFHFPHISTIEPSLPSAPIPPRPSVVIVVVYSTLRAREVSFVYYWFKVGWPVCVCIFVYYSILYEQNSRNETGTICACLCSALLYICVREDPAKEMNSSGESFPRATAATAADTLEDYVQRLRAAGVVVRPFPVAFLWVYTRTHARTSRLYIYKDHLHTPPPPLLPYV